MVLRNIPLPVVEILFDEIRNYAECSSCGEVKLCEKRQDYIADMDEDDCCGTCKYYLFFTERGHRGMPKMYQTELTKTEDICHDCLSMFQDNHLEELDKYR